METKESYHHGRLREALLEAALRELEVSGTEGLSLRGLAESLGVSKSAPYRHFKSKHELLVALAAEGFRDFADRLEAAAALDGAGAFDRLLNVAEGYVDFARARPALYRLMFSRFGYSLHSEACKRNSLRTFGGLIAAVGAAQESGWKRERPRASLSLSIWAAVHGWAGFLIDGLIPEESDFNEESWRGCLRSLIED